MKKLLLLAPLFLFLPLFTSAAMCPTLSEDMWYKSCDEGLDEELCLRTVSGDQVSQLQNFLTDHYQPTTNIIIGYFGRRTESFVRRFQAEHGLPQTGRVGPLTRAAVQRVCGNTSGDTGSGSTGNSGSTGVVPICPAFYPVPPTCSDGSPVATYTSGCHTGWRCPTATDIPAQCPPPQPTTACATGWRTIPLGVPDGLGMCTLGWVCDSIGNTGNSGAGSSGTDAASSGSHSGCSSDAQCGAGYRCSIVQTETYPPRTYGQCVRSGSAICTPLTPQTQTLTCPAGQTGSITETRISSCPTGATTPVWGEWVTTANSCAPITTTSTYNAGTSVGACVSDGITYEEGATLTTVPYAGHPSRVSFTCDNGVWTQFVGDSTGDRIVVLRCVGATCSYSGGKNNPLQFRLFGHKVGNLLHGRAPYTFTIYATPPCTAATVSWGDGSITELAAQQCTNAGALLSAPNLTHTYTAPGNYTITQKDAYGGPTDYPGKIRVDPVTSAAQSSQLASALVALQEILEKLRTYLGNQD